LAQNYKQFDMTSKEDYIEKIDALLLLDDDTRKTSDLYYFFVHESETNPNQTLDTLLSIMEPTARVEVLSFQILTL
jgi:hypothetical protein